MRRSMGSDAAGVALLALDHLAAATPQGEPGQDHERHACEGEQPDGDEHGGRLGWARVAVTPARTGGSAPEQRELDAAAAGAAQAELLGGGLAEVDHAAAVEWAAVVDPHHDRAAVVGHADLAAER